MIIFHKINDLEINKIFTKVWTIFRFLYTTIKIQIQGRLRYKISELELATTIFGAEYFIISVILK